LYLSIVFTEKTNTKSYYCLKPKKYTMPPDTSIRRLELLLRQAIRNQTPVSHNAIESIANRIGQQAGTPSHKIAQIRQLINRARREGHLPKTMAHHARTQLTRHTNTTRRLQK
jgi:hypothetical protein